MKQNGHDHAGPPAAPRRAPASMDGEAFRQAGHALVDSIADLIDSWAQRPVTADDSPDDIRGLLDARAPLPEHGRDGAEVLARATRLLFDHSLFNGHPRFFGYVTSSPAPIGMLGDLLAAAVNANVAAWRVAPVASEIEAQTVRWIAELIGYPAGCGGLLVSGGTAANVVGVLCARAAIADGRLRRSGLNQNEAGGWRIYASAETHTWLQKAADMTGLGTDAIRWIPVDTSLRMDMGALRAAIEADRDAGRRPLTVVGTAGTVSTGAVDPLADIADLCREQGIWFHVDGAYGGFAAAVPDAPADLTALRQADSVALDPHKWLYAPLEAGCVLVREPGLLRDAFSYHPPYYHFGQEAANYVDLGPQNSRGFRALKVWLALQQVGRRGYMQMIGDDIRLARRLHDLVSVHREFEALTRDLSITTFRYVPPELRAGIGDERTEAYLNELNEALLERIERSGEAFVSNAVIAGRYALRACIVNFNTGPDDIAALPEVVARHGQALDAALRAGDAPAA